MVSNSDRNRLFEPMSSTKPAKFDAAPVSVSTPDDDADDRAGDADGDRLPRAVDQAAAHDRAASRGRP